MGIIHTDRVYQIVRNLCLLRATYESVLFCFLFRKLHIWSCSFYNKHYYPPRGELRTCNLSYCMALERVGNLKFVFLIHSNNLQMQREIAFKHLPLKFNQHCSVGFLENVVQSANAVLKINMNENTSCAIIFMVLLKIYRIRKLYFW